MSRLKRATHVYLAGGMRSGWQDKVMAAVNDARKAAGLGAIIWLDPRSHGCGDDEVAYTSWDLTAVETSNVIFTYMEADNPAGHGLAVEIGYARGLERATGSAPRQVIFVCERDAKPYRYLGMARVCSDHVRDTLDDGISKLIEVLYNWDREQS